MPPPRRSPADPPRRRPVVAGQRSRRRIDGDAPPETAAPEAPPAGRRRLGRGSTAVAGPATEEPSRRRRLPVGRLRLPGRVPPLVPGLLALAAVALLVLVGVFGYQLRNAWATESAREDALATASSHAVRILSYDAATLDEDFDEAQDVVTGEFAEQYQQTTEDLVRPTATANNVVVVAEVAAVSVVSAEPEEVVVLAFVNQTTTSDVLSAPKVDQNRVRMTMVPADDTWKVSGVTAL